MSEPKPQSPNGKAAWWRVALAGVAIIVAICAPAVTYLAGKLDGMQNENRNEHLGFERGILKNGERITALEATRSDIIRRLDRIETKLDAVLK